MRKAIALLMGAVVLAVANYAIYERERIIGEGRIALLELAPVDPRSLMQGDYMALRFKAATDAFGSGQVREDVRDGRIVLKPDARGVASFVRLDVGGPLAPDEFLMRYRIRDRQVKFATNAFFFQEGHADRYETARYGEFRVAADGDAILTGLRGKDLEPLGEAPRP